ncbi:MAG: PEP-CTERM sorting domain-containing protein [Candidatus Accumulibacter sp.]|nr:PEP-CTERM sorting domain-containing protein [Accumulibacter sp.]
MPRRRSVTTFAGMALATLLVAGEEAWAAPYSVLLESNADRSNNEIYLANYDSFAKLLSNTLSASSAYSALNVSSNFSVGGFTQVNGGYSVLLESNADRSSNEIYLANYASYVDLLSNTLDGSSAFSTLNVSSNFSVGGFTYDPSGYSVLLESDADRSSNEIYIAHYVDYAALLSNTLSPRSGYSALNVSSNFSVGGFTFDGSGYSVLLESDIDRANNEIYLANYASFDDLISNTLASTSAYSDLNVSSAFSVGGLAAEWQTDGNPGDTIDHDGDFPDGDPGDGGGRGGNPDDNPGGGGGPGGTPVPEPTTLSLLAIAGFALAARRRRKNS